MATKLYLHNAANDQSGTYPSGSQATTPLTQDYQFTGSTSIKKMNTTIGTSQASMSGTSSGTTSAQTVLLGMWTSPPLAAQTLASAAITINMALAQSSTSMNLGLEFSAELYVWRPSTGAKVGTIQHAVDYSGDQDATSANSEQVDNGTSTSSTSVTAQAGDVIILEIIDTHVQSMASAYTGTIYYDGTTETATTGTVVSNHASYINFSTDITFQGSGVTVDSSTTFGAMTISADADVAVAAASSVTFGNMTLSSDSDVAVVASSAVTFDNMTLSGTITPDIVDIDAAITFGDTTISATGTVNVVASGSVTFENMTVASDSDVAVVASGNLTFGDMTVSSDGDVSVVASSSISFADMGLSGTISVGSVSANMDASITFDGMTLQSAAAVIVSAVSSVVFADMAAAGSGVVSVGASSAVTFDSMTLSSDGDVFVVAQSNITFNNMTLTSNIGAENTLVGLEAFVSGYPGALGDQVKNFLLANGATDSSVEDMWMQFFASKGVASGALLDRMRAFLITYTGAADTGQTIEDLWSLVTGPYVP